MEENESGVLPEGELPRSMEEKEIETECGKETDEANDVGVPFGCADEHDGGGEDTEGICEMALGADHTASLPPLRETETEKRDPRDLTTGVRAARRDAYEELQDFFTLFPEVGFSEIPLSVRESDLPLAAAYALYEKREQKLRRDAERENERNRVRSAGGLADGGEIPYTRDEVRGMSPREIRENLDAVMRAMRLW